MKQHVCKWRAFSSRYPISALKYYITYGLGANQGIFLTLCTLEEEHKKLSSATPWACWPGISTALCSRDSPFDLWDQRFSLFAHQTTVRRLAGNFGFKFSLWNILSCACCRLRRSFGHWWGLVLRKGLTSHTCGERSWYGSSALCWYCRTVLWDQPPRDAHLPNQLWNHLPSCCGAAWNFWGWVVSRHFSGATVLRFGEAVTCEEEPHRMTKFSVHITQRKTCCAVCIPVQGLKAATPFSELGSLFHPVLMWATLMPAHVTYMGTESFPPICLYSMSCVAFWGFAGIFLYIPWISC